MNVVIRETAEDDIDHIYSWIATDNPHAARRLVSRIPDRISLLELDPLAHMGRSGFIEGTRELIEYPYIIVYKVFEERREIVVLSVIHGARSREK